MFRYEMSVGRGTLGSVIDALPATARVQGLALVTRNVRDVAWTGVACLDPFHAR